MLVSDSDLNVLTRNQRTLSKVVSISGIGIHSGKSVTLTLCPADPNTGVVFQRMDLPGEPLIPASVDHVVNTNRSTTIGIKDAFVNTVEHVCAALKAYEVDNVLVQVSDQETPIGDGSSRVFVEMIEESGIEEQSETTSIVKIDRPVFWSKGETYLVALPHYDFRVSYSLHYPNAKLLQNQFHTITLSPEIFKEEIASCRTFSCYGEVQPLMDQGLIKGGSLENTLVIKDDAVLNPKGLHFENEMARHKLLDLIGDFSLTGLNLHAHIIGYRTGHDANIQFAKELRDSINTEKLTCQSM
ncbi:MAG: UDP-3-O-acyl-N-acetylglucosamine deacetylase [Chlamydiae bacterium]|nr:UDP-3-O-acyl-N-acetylglucosamine deacetylase [Chlamydiota bacterium]